MDQILSQITTWCTTNGINYGRVYHESNTYGIVILNKTMGRRLLEHITPSCREHNTHCNLLNVRGGVIITLSENALSETIEAEMIYNFEENESNSFIDAVLEDRDNDYYSGHSEIIIRVQAEVIEGESLPSDEETAHYGHGIEWSDVIYKVYREGVDEDLDTVWAQPITTFKDEDDIEAYGIEAAEKENLRAYYTDLNGKTKLIWSPDRQKAQVQSEAKPDSIYATFADLFDQAIKKDSPNLNEEALGGIATPSGNQPTDLRDRLISAIKELGLKKSLRGLGIKMRLSQDGRNIVFSMKNAETGAEQPIKIIPDLELDDQHKFKLHLDQLIDIAKGNAPGTGEAERKRVQEVDRQLRDVASQFVPQKQQPKRPGSPVI